MLLIYKPLSTNGRNKLFCGNNNIYNNNYVGIIIITIRISWESLTTKMYHSTHFNQIIVLIYNNRNPKYLYNCATIYYVLTNYQE